MASPTAVAPTFRSPRQAVAFCAAVILLLALPALFSALGLYSRRDAYLETPIGDGGFVYTAKQVLDERSDLDMVFLGDSMLWLGVDTPYVQQALARAEGHEVAVRTFGHAWPGIDVDYATLRDAVARRRVGTVVLAMPRAVQMQARPHFYSYHLLPYGEDPAMLQGLALQHRLTLYAESVLGAPRHVVSLLRRGPDFAHAVEPTLGAHLVEQGFYGAPYQPVTRDPPDVPVETLLHTPATADRFVFTGPPPTDYQAHFARLIADLLRAHGIRLVTFHVPRWSDRKSPVVEDCVDWQSFFGVEGSLVGIAPAPPLPRDDRRRDHEPLHQRPLQRRRGALLHPRHHPRPPGGPPPWPLRRPPPAPRGRLRS